MRILLTLILVCSLHLTQAQCPNRDSILYNRQLGYIIPSPPYPPFYGDWLPITGINYTWGYTKPKMPPVNNDIKTSKRKVDRKGYAELYYQDLEDSVLLAKGRYANGKKLGYWVWFYSNGDTMSKGKYVNGLKSGTWVEYQESEHLKCIGSFVAGRKEGLWKTISYENLELPQAQRIQAKENYHLGLLNGTTKYFTEGKLSTIYNYDMGWIQGKVVSYFTDVENEESGKHISTIHNYLNGQLNGTCFSYDVDGRILTKYNYINGHQTGTQYSWDYDNETKEVYAMKNGQRHGWTMQYYRNKLVNKTYYLNNIKNGLSWIIENNQKRIEHYKNDILNGSCEHYTKLENGQWELSYRIMYAMGKKRGREYIKSGNDVYVNTYKKGMLDGFRYFLRDGDTVYSNWYKNDVLHGKGIRNDQHLRCETIYENGLRLSEKYSIHSDTTKNYTLYYHNEYVYDKKNACFLPNGWLLEKQFDLNGNLVGERSFSPFGTKPDTANFISYYPNGKTKETSAMVNHQLGGIQRKFNQNGDTITYINSYAKWGRFIQVMGNVIQKGYWINGKLSGEVEFWVYDTVPSVNLQFNDKSKLYLAAKGEMYADEAFGTWTYYEKTGTKWFEGCHCGLFQNSNGFQVISNFSDMYAFESGREFKFRGSVCGNYEWRFPSGILYRSVQGKIFSEYNESGQLIMRGQLIKGVREGIWEFFDDAGNRTEKRFEQGRDVPM